MDRSQDQRVKPVMDVAGKDLNERQTSLQREKEKLMQQMENSFKKMTNNKALLEKKKSI